jgi:hypothetical protein
MASNLTSPVLIDGMDVMAGFLIPGAATRRVVTTSTSSDETYKYWSQNTDPTYHHTTITAAHAACTSGRNDVVLLSPNNHSQAATITWSNNMNHLIGMYGPAMMNMRTRIIHSVTVDPLLHVTGYGCTFANLYTSYAETDLATDLTCLKVTGNRNSFVHCHWGGPMGATAADQAGFAMVRFAETSGGDGLEHYFRNCTIGIETIAWSAGTMFRTAGTPRLVFENCIFLMRSDANGVTFFDGTAGDGAGFVMLRNCTGINLGTALTVAIGSTGIASATDYILHNSGFTGATDLIAAADEAKAIMIAQPNDATTGDLFAGLGIPADHTA